MDKYLYVWLFTDKTQYEQAAFSPKNQSLSIQISVYVMVNLLRSIAWTIQRCQGPAVGENSQCDVWGSLQKQLVLLLLYLSVGRTDGMWQREKDELPVLSNPIK